MPELTEDIAAYDSMRADLDLRALIQKCWHELDKPELTPEERQKIREQVSVLATKLAQIIVNMK
jgi:hypothetical protein